MEAEDDQEASEKIIEANNLKNQSSSTIQSRGEITSPAESSRPVNDNEAGKDVNCNIIEDVIDTNDHRNGNLGVVVIVKRSVNKQAGS